MDKEGNQYARDEESVIYNKSGKWSMLSHMIFNLIADSRLPNPFNIEQLLSLLNSDSLLPQDGTIYELYSSLYKKKYGNIKSKKEELDILDGIFGSLQKKKTDAVVA